MKGQQLRPPVWPAGGHRGIGAGICLAEQCVVTVRLPFEGQTFALQIVKSPTHEMQPNTCQTPRLNTQNKMLELEFEM